MTTKDFIQKFFEHVERFRTSLSAYNGTIYTQELKDWKNKFQRPLEMGSEIAPQEFLSPQEFLLERQNQFKNSVNEEAFETLYFSEWTLNRGASLVKKIEKIQPVNDVEKETVNALHLVAEALTNLNTEVKRITPLSGRRKKEEIEDWARRPEPDKFTCSCCLRRQAKNPNDSRKIADHGYVNEGYRKGVCAGASFPPLEESGEGNIWMMKALEKKLSEHSQVIGKQYLENNVNNLILEARSQCRLMAEALEFRKFLHEGMEHFGGYKAFVEEKISFKNAGYKKYFYGRLEELGGFSWIENIFKEYLETKQDVTFQTYMEDKGNLGLSYFIYNKPEYSETSEFSWYEENVPVSEFLNLAEIFGHTGWNLEQMFQEEYKLEASAPACK